MKIIVADAEAQKYLKLMNAKALYMEQEGTTGSILLSESATRAEIMEESIHHQQRRLYGNDYFYEHNIEIGD